MFTVLLCLNGDTLTAQEVDLRGKVSDHITGEPIVGAVVKLDGTPYGTFSKTDGSFLIKGVPYGVYELSVTLIGYGRLWKAIRVTENTPYFTLALKESEVSADEIEVVADEERQRKEDTRTSVYKLKPREVKAIAGGVEDVLRTLQSVPGVLAQNDFSSQLIVRGSGPDQNLMLIDDIEVFNPYRLYGTISMFNPETISDVNLITGGFPARYGDRLSAVLDVTNRDGNREVPFGTLINANVTDANIVAEGRAPFGLNGSWLVSARRTYYDLIVGPILRGSGLVDQETAFPNFTDFQSKLAFQLTPEHRLHFTTLISRDAVNVITAQRTNERPDSTSVFNQTDNNTFGASWHFRPSQDIFNRFTVSWYGNSGTTEFGGVFADRFNYSSSFFSDLQDCTAINPASLANQSLESSSTFSFIKTSARNEVSVSRDHHFIEAGAGIDVLTTKLSFFITANERLRAIFRAIQGGGRVGTLPFDTSLVQSRTYYRTNLYVQDRWEIIPEVLYIQPGLRFDFYQIIDRAYLSPRFNFSYALSAATTLRGAWGMYFQSPGYEKLIDQNQFFDLSQSSDFIRSLRAEKAIHYVLGVDHWFDDKWQIKTEVYYKALTNLLVQAKTPQTVFTTEFLGGNAYDERNWRIDSTQGFVLSPTPVNEGIGAAYGFEVLLAKRNKTGDDRFSGWVTYALAFAQRNRDGLTIPFNFDQRHTFNLIGDYKFSESFNLGARWRFGTGFPVTEPLGIQPRLLVDSLGNARIDVDQLQPGRRVLFNIQYGGEENLNQARLPSYHRLDVRLTYSTEFWGGSWQFYLDIINLYNRTNVIGFRNRAPEQIEVPLGERPEGARIETGMLPIVPTFGISAVF